MILEIMLMLRMLTESIVMMLTFAIRRHIFYQGFFRHWCCCGQLCILFLLSFLYLKVVNDDNWGRCISVNGRGYSNEWEIGWLLVCSIKANICWIERMSIRIDITRKDPVMECSDITLILSLFNFVTVVSIVNFTSIVSSLFMFV